MFPVCVTSRSHFVLFIVDTNRKVVLFMDSMKQEGMDQKEDKMITAFMKLLTVSKHELHLPDDLRMTKKDMPQQSNTFDCGMYVILFGMQYVTGSKEVITPSEVCIFR